MRPRGRSPVPFLLALRPLDDTRCRPRCGALGGGHGGVPLPTCLSLAACCIDGARPRPRRGTRAYRWQGTEPCQRGCLAWGGVSSFPCRATRSAAGAASWGLGTAKAPSASSHCDRRQPPRSGPLFWGGRQTSSTDSASLLSGRRGGGDEEAEEGQREAGRARFKGVWGVPA